MLVKLDHKTPRFGVQIKKNMNCHHLENNVNFPENHPLNSQNHGFTYPCSSELPVVRRRLFLGTKQVHFNHPQGPNFHRKPLHLNHPHRRLHRVPPPEICQHDTPGRSRRGCDSPKFGWLLCISRAFEGFLQK